MVVRPQPSRLFIVPYLSVRGRHSARGTRSNNSWSRRAGQGARAGAQGLAEHRLTRRRRPRRGLSLLTPIIITTEECPRPQSMLRVLQSTKTTTLLCTIVVEPYLSASVTHRQTRRVGVDGSDIRNCGYSLHVPLFIHYRHSINKQLALVQMEQASRIHNGCTVTTLLT